MCVRDVLLVPRDDDQVVAGGEIVASRDALEVLVGQVVGLPTRVHEEPEETALLRAVVRRLALREERTAELHVLAAMIDVPRVAVPVACLVEEVVGLPAVGR